MNHIPRWCSTPDGTSSCTIAPPAASSSGRGEDSAARSTGCDNCAETRCVRPLLSLIAPGVLIGCLCFRVVLVLLSFLCRQFAYQISMPLSQDKGAHFLAVHCGKDWSSELACYAAMTTSRLHVKTSNVRHTGQTRSSSTPVQLGSLRRDRRNRRQIPNSGIQATS